MVDSAIAKLAEHFDHVQLLISYNEQDNTRSLFRGSGNWFARQGMAHNFIQRDIANETAESVSRELKLDDNE